MSKIKIPFEEFKQRIENIRKEMQVNNIDAMMVYGDEYRKENLRYVSNFWPIFERGALLIPKTGEPIYAGAPEGEPYAKEMCPYKVVNLKEFLCVTVVDDIDYPLAVISNFKDLLNDILGGGKNLGVVGINDMPGVVYNRIVESIDGLNIVDTSDIINKMRLVKSDNEIACLREAGRLACVAYEKFLEYCVPGNTERYMTGAGEGAARMAGAENIAFSVVGSGERINTVIGRDTDKVMQDGDMIMAAIAVQYEGYVSTAEFPFVCGTMSDMQREFIKTLVEASNIAISKMVVGQPMANMVKSVRDYFRSKGLDKYDVYPPMHGIGLAEAEDPYPDENSTRLFENNMTVNTDISLFGIPELHGNRVEESLLITENGVESLTPLIRKMLQEF